MRVKIKIKNKLEKKNNSIIRWLNWKKNIKHKDKKFEKNEDRIITRTGLNMSVLFQRDIKKIDNDSKRIIFFKKNNHDNLEIQIPESI